MATVAISRPSTLGVYRALQLRNRMVGAMRLLVPLIGVLVLAALFVQVLIASFESEFAIGRVAFERNRLVVDTPSYAGILADGSSYNVTAGSAETALEKPSVIDLANAHVVLHRANGIDVTADAELAEVETQLQLIDIPGLATLSDTDGLAATVIGLHADLPAQIVTGGLFEATYADGMTLAAEGVRYDAAAGTWTFTGVNVTLPRVPGAEPRP